MDPASGAAAVDDERLEAVLASLREATHLVRDLSEEARARLRRECSALHSALQAASTPMLLSLPSELLVRIFALGDAAMLSTLDATCTTFRTLHHGGRSILDAACVAAAEHTHGAALTRLMPPKQSALIRLAWLEDAARLGRAWGERVDEVIERMEAHDAELNVRLMPFGVPQPRRIAAADGCIALVAASLLQVVHAQVEEHGNASLQVADVLESAVGLLDRLTAQVGPQTGPAPFRPHPFRLPPLAQALAPRRIHPYLDRKSVV